MGPRAPSILSPPLRFDPVTWPCDSVERQHLPAFYDARPEESASWGFSPAAIDLTAFSEIPINSSNFLHPRIGTFPVLVQRYARIDWETGQRMLSRPVVGHILSVFIFLLAVIRCDWADFRLMIRVTKRGLWRSIRQSIKEGAIFPPFPGVMQP